MISGIVNGLSPGAGITVTVGVGGPAAVAGANGTSGGDSSFGSYLTAKGGVRGLAAVTGGAGGNYYVQASVLVTGISCRSNRMNIFSVGSDDPPVSASLKSDMDGLSPSVMPTAGGAGGISGSLAAGGVGGTGTIPGGTGTAYGGGGGGGAAADSNHAGGAGANGVVVVMW